MPRVYDIFSDEMKEVTEEGLKKFQEVHRAYVGVRVLVNFYSQMPDPGPVLRDFLQELEQLHQDLKSRLTTQEDPPPVPD